ncbi:hypothetical protein ABI59_17670 [Acidobacteria bacterium Mor1]|nr:hypothetical protein ABI59_17670 [Acidobacteria bacterium Mor1]
MLAKLVRPLLAAFLVLAVLAGASPAAASGKQLPVEAFGDLPFVSDIQLSPDGKNLAILQRYEDRIVVRFQTLGGKPLFTYYPEDSTVRAVEWLTPDWALITVDFEQISRAYRGAVKMSRLIAVSPDGKKRNMLMRGFAGKTVRELGARLPQSTRLLSPSVIGEKYVLTSAWIGYSSVFKVSLLDGLAELERMGEVRAAGRELRHFTTGWMVNHDHSSWLRWNQDNRTEPPVNVVQAKAGKEDWVEIDRYPVGGTPKLSPQGFGERPGLLYVIARSPGGTSALYEYDIRQRKLGKKVFQHPNHDLERAEIDPRNGKLIGVHYHDDEPRQQIIDAEQGELQATIDAYFKSTSVNRIRSRSADGQSVIISASGPNTPASFHLFNQSTMQMSRLGAAYPDLGVAMGEVRPVAYSARDGLEIRGYLTTPAGVEPKKLPTVILPHGGPQSRDVMVFDWMAQFLANRGYAVLQPNFRGSTGRGEAFRVAGYGEWGGKMQDDVTDGTRYLIEQGIADPERICIMGASYGGYAALMGVAKEPDLYACAISINGVADIYEMMRESRRSTAIQFWERSIGADKEMQKANSPARLVAKIKSPILLIHGEKDHVVEFDQARLMRKAMKRVGKPLEFVKLDGDDHFLSTGPTRIAAMKAVDSFLKIHLAPGAKAPPAETSGH